MINIGVNFKIQDSPRRNTAFLLSASALPGFCNFGTYLANNSMTSRIKNIKETGFKEPMVIFPLKQYEALIEYLEDIEDRLSIQERLNEPTLSQEKVEEYFTKKFGDK